MKKMTAEQKRFLLVPAAIFGAAAGLGHRWVMDQVAAWGITHPVANFAVMCLIFWVPALIVGLILRPFFPKSPNPPTDAL